jgi:hypothetical protein
MFSAPTRIAPARSSRVTSVASVFAGGWLRLMRDPATVGSPAMSIRFFTANGTPASGPTRCPARRAASIEAARARARSAAIAVKLFSTLSCRAMRSSVVSTTAVAVRLPSVTLCAISAAVRKGASLMR